MGFCLRVRRGFVGFSVRAKRNHPCPTRRDLCNQFFMRKTTLIFGFLSLLVLYIGLRYIYYGRLLANCIYTEEIIPFPAKLKEGQLQTFKDAYIASGVEPDYECLSDFKSINFELIEPATIQNLTIGESYFTHQERKVIKLPAGEKVFHIDEIIQITGHGITTIDGGSSPMPILILTDQFGNKYSIGTVETGLNKEDLFLKWVSPEGETIITPEFFDQILSSK